MKILSNDSEGSGALPQNQEGKGGKWGCSLGKLNNEKAAHSEPKSNKRRIMDMGSPNQNWDA